MRVRIIKRGVLPHMSIQFSVDPVEYDVLVEFVGEKQAVFGDVPAFDFPGGPKVSLSKLPDPKEPFGLNLHRSTWDSADEEIKALSGKKSLQILILSERN